MIIKCQRFVCVTGIAASKEEERAEPLHEYLGLTSEELVALLDRPEDVDEILGITDADVLAEE